ncbi:sigma-70 family RNA polymerase sigma factor [Alicyclobacillaceae bacterium I2511]|nr:sigma-70 family RNA polymerase sigma factor [Alicyclobacillaceae bacterium I2511]
MTEGQDGYTPEQEVAWCKTVIRNAAMNAIKKYARWQRESLTLNTMTEDGDEVENLIPSEEAERAFKNCELHLALKVLSEREQIIIKRMYLYGYTQRELVRSR